MSRESRQDVRKTLPGERASLKVRMRYRLSGFCEVYKFLFSAARYRLFWFFSGELWGSNGFSRAILGAESATKLSYAREPLSVSAIPSSLPLLGAAFYGSTLLI